MVRLTIVLVLVAQTPFLRAAKESRHSQKCGAAKWLDIDGTYIQLWDRHHRWDERTWSEKFRYLDDLGTREVVVQWSAYEDSAFYESDRIGVASPLERILVLAREHHMRVWVGLHAERAWWGLAGGDVSTVAAYLDGLREKSLAIARRIAPMASAISSFHGWYLPEEIDDETWMAAWRQESLHGHLRTLAADLAALIPGRGVAISGFTNGARDGASLRQFWADLLKDAPKVTTLMFQDGIGASKLTLGNASSVLREIREATQTRQRELKVVVEAFRLRGPSSDAALGFHAEAAPLEELLAQTRLANEVSTAGKVVFSAFDYLTPGGERGAGELYRSYLAVRKRRREAASCLSTNL